MNLKAKIQNMHYSKFRLTPFACALLAPSFFYKIGINIKNFLYEIKFLKEKSVGARVICVGNLTTGGVGKTPIVIELANYLSQSNKVCIISRGYKGKLSSKNINVIKDYEKILIEDPILSGDEPNLIAKNIPRAMLITSANRVVAANYAIKSYGAEVIILDDGFTNRKLKKDFQILLFDTEKNIGNGKLLPLGPLREPLKEIKRANKILLMNKSGRDFELEENVIKFFNYKPIEVCNVVSDVYTNPKTGEKISKKQKNIYAFCAIGQPDSFYNFLKKDFNVLGATTFSDHHSYTSANLKELEQNALSRGADAIITTEKDYVKISKHEFLKLPLFVLKLKNEINIERLLS